MSLGTSRSCWRGTPTASALWHFAEGAGILVSGGQRRVKAGSFRWPGRRGVPQRRVIGNGSNRWWQRWRLEEPSTTWDLVVAPALFLSNRKGKAFVLQKKKR